jgi:hypothetical protein
MRESLTPQVVAFQMVRPREFLITDLTRDGPRVGRHDGKRTMAPSNSFIGAASSMITINSFRRSEIEARKLRCESETRTSTTCRAATSHRRPVDPGHAFPDAGADTLTQP